MTTYLKELRAMIDSREKSLINGGPKSWEEYKERVGQIAGLRLALAEYEKQGETKSDDD